MSGEPPAAKRPIRIHATNITGIGATQLVQSLLPEMERTSDVEPFTLYLPSEGALSTYVPFKPATKLIHMKRVLPNAVSRIFECTFLARRFQGAGALLVLGDIPLRCKGRQTVLVQMSLLTSNSRSHKGIGAIKYMIARGLFRMNARFVSAFIVQTEAMKHALARTYPQISARIHVIGQPAPAWLLASNLQRTGITRNQAQGLKLFYPAAGYPHKNHLLLSRIAGQSGATWPIRELILTVDQNNNPNTNIEWIKCVGRLGPERMLTEYGTADGLLFLSLSESLGFPLVEAMCIGLPIICPDLPYARVLCGDEAIYFEPSDILSLKAAVMELQQRLHKGWWPNWEDVRKRIPTSWAEVATSMLRVTSGANAILGE